MSSLVDVWRAVDPDAQLVSGDADALARAVRGVLRTRAAPPHLPPSADGELLVVDAAIVAADGPSRFLAALPDAGLAPAAVLLAGTREPVTLDAPVPTAVFASQRAAGDLAAAAASYLDDEPGFVAQFATGLRLAAAEAALADARVSAPAGLVAARLRRGVAVAVGGELRSLHPRPAGRALAARFAATHARLLAGSSNRQAGARRTREGLWLIEQPIQMGASVWLFDDLPFARVDAAAAEALAITLRALLRRSPEPERPAPRPPSPQPPPLRSGDSLTETLLAVARANGRVAPAARSLGVHRNTVLYRLRVARAERGVDPRRPADALRLLREAEGVGDDGP